MSFFGTDGIRGRAGEGKLSPDNLVRIGRALAALVGASATVVIGRDTRESGKGILDALAAELSRGGVRVLDVGVLPTPATAFLTRKRGAALGVMITASHNPWHDNGVKLFSPSGTKLTDAMQAELETLIEGAPEPSAEGGSITRDQNGLSDYAAFLADVFPRVDLSGLHIVVDGANGAGHAVLADAFRARGCTVSAIGNDPDGRNINAGVGSTAMDACVAAMRAQGADVGFALDGDADRIMAVTARGEVMDGDQIVARLAADAQQAGGLRGGAVVSTVMANLGLERWAESAGLRLERTKVGDRHVHARMEAIGANFGGEPSGHILTTDRSSTGDGCLTAVWLAVSLAAARRREAQWMPVFEPVPQVLVNVRYGGGAPLDSAAVQQVIAAQTERLAGQGRVLVRASGTEPVIRVMAEGDDRALISDAVEIIAAAIRATA